MWLTAIALNYKNQNFSEGRKEPVTGLRRHPLINPIFELTCRLHGETFSASLTENEGTKGAMQGR